MWWFPKRQKDLRVYHHLPMDAGGRFLGGAILTAIAAAGGLVIGHHVEYQEVPSWGLLMAPGLFACIGLALLMCDQELRWAADGSRVLIRYRWWILVVSEEWARGPKGALPLQIAEHDGSWWLLIADDDRQLRIHREAEHSQLQQWLSKRGVDYTTISKQNTQA